MLDKQVIAYLRLVHGAYNLVVILFFYYQGLLGLGIRKARKAGGLNPRAARRHRRSGPLLVILAMAGLAGGGLLGFLDNGRLLKYPYHFINGVTIIFCILATAIVSHRMSPHQERRRNTHVILGVLILCLYALQAVLGLDILF